MTDFPEDYWSTYEHTVSSFRGYVEAIEVITAYQAATDSRFVWRGTARASHAMHSSLVRRELARGPMPSEERLQELEKELLAEARDWRLDWHQQGGRLMALDILAGLQHFHGPTRMIDFTFNPLIALWFAVEKHDAADGRVFAIDVAGRQVQGARTESREPWWFDEPRGVTDPWRSECWVWRPPPIEARIVRQESCFLLGGIPSTHPARNVNRPGHRIMRAAEIRECMSVPFRLIKYAQAVAASRGEILRGTPPRARAFTIRISNKPDIRRVLEQSFSYSNASLFPDISGFHERGRTTGL